MIRLIQRRLIIPRGDTGTFTVPVFATNSIGDVAVFSIMDERTNSKVFEKVVQVSDTTMTIEFNHSDTVNLPVGKFVWDIKFYQNPTFVDNELVDGEEIDSYYAAFSLPVCEIRQTADKLLMADNAPTTTLAANQLNYINAVLNDINAAKQSLENYVTSITLTEEDMVATKNIEINEYFMIKNTLFQATASIEQEEQIIPGTNCTQINIADALNALQQ